MIVALAYLAILVFVAIFAPLISPHDPNAINPQKAYLGPSGSYWLGTDDLGRDMLSRLMYGARVSLGLSAAVVASALIISIPLGLVSGYKGRWLDQLIMRSTDITLSVPAIVLGLAFAAALGPSEITTAIAIVVIVTPQLLRVVRGESLAKSAEPYVEASITSGSRTRKILLKRLLPNVRPSVIVAATFAFGNALLFETTLSYLGVGVQAPTASWGNMLREAYDNSLFTQPLQLVFPGVAIMSAILAFYVIGDGLRDVLGVSDLSGPRRRGVRGITTVEITPHPARPAPDEQTGGALLQVKDLSVMFQTHSGSTSVLDHVSFDIAHGEAVGLVGESGSGKTVTSLSIMRLLPSPPAQIVGGQILFKGTDVLQMPADRLRMTRGREIAMIFQDPMTALDPCFKIGHQLIEAYRLHSDIDRGTARRHATELLDRVHISDAANRMNNYPHELSGGMRQRVMIAMALICRPKLLIADEPTTALDVTVQKDILQILREQRDELRMSILFVTHDLAVVSNLCDRVLVMYAGQIIETGTAESCFAAPKHPYTAALLSAMPEQNQRGSGLASIPGGVPLPGDYPEGCRFSPRCAYVVNDCRRTQPSLRPVAPDAYARCMRAEELDLGDSRISPVHRQIERVPDK
jgi:peptide/nickel transport system permease protein